MLTSCALAASLAALTTLTPGNAFAQAGEAGGAGGKVVTIRKIEPAKLRTPEYQLARGGIVSQTREWGQITVLYDTTPKWIDELTFTYYVHVKGKEGSGKINCFRGDVTYVNVQEGHHKSDMYLHPSTITRFGEVDRIAVLVSYQGRLVAIDTVPVTNQRWWEQMTPVDGYVLNRMETPFAMISFDDYEAIKPKAGPAR